MSMPAAAPQANSLTEEARTMADRIIAQADAGQFPMPAMVLGKLQSGDFELDGLNFKFRQSAVNGNHMLHCTARVCYLPYTAEQRARRTALQHIVRASRQLHYAHFKLGHHNMIEVEGDIPLPAAHGDEDVIMALLAFYQEARPLLQLMAQQYQ